MFFVYVGSRSTGTLQSINPEFRFSASRASRRWKKRVAILSINSGPVQSFEPIDSRYNRKICCNDWLSS